MKLLFYCILLLETDYKQGETTEYLMRTSAERRSYEHQKTCGLRYDVPGIDRNSYAESSANG